MEWTVFTRSLGALAWAAAAVPAAQAATQPGAAAFAVSATLVSSGTQTGLAPVAAVEGGLSAAYDTPADVASLDQTIPIAANNKRIGTLTVSGSALHAHVVSGGFGVDSVSVGADGAADAIQLAMQPYPPPPGDAIPLPALLIVATGMTSSVTAGQVFPQQPFVSVGGGFTAVTVSGTWLGGKVLASNGPAVPNTVLYHSGGVTVTATRVIRDGALVCAARCTFNTAGATVDALSVDLNEVTLGGRKVSGHIVLGQSAVELH